MDTFALDTNLWDLDVDVRGNLRTVGDATPQSMQTGPGMRLAQDVATRCMAWRGEVYYDATQGVRLDAILGGAPNVAFAQDAFQTEALKVPGCATALPLFAFSATSRRLTGTMTVSSSSGYGGTVALPT